MPVRTGIPHRTRTVPAPAARQSFRSGRRPFLPSPSLDCRVGTTASRALSFRCASVVPQSAFAHLLSSTTAPVCSASACTAPTRSRWNVGQMSSEAVAPASPGCGVKSSFRPCCACPQQHRFVIDQLIQCFRHPAAAAATVRDECPKERFRPWSVRVPVPLRARALACQTFQERESGSLRADRTVIASGQRLPNDPSAASSDSASVHSPNSDVKRCFGGQQRGADLSG